MSQVAAGAARPPLSVVVPVHNGGATLAELHTRLTNVLAEWAAPYELIFVDDGSADDSAAVVERLAAADSRVRGLLLWRNYGQHNALVAGIRVAANDVVVTMDDDLQHRPEDVPALVAALGDDVDLVYGQGKEGGHGLLRGVASRLTKASLAAAAGWDVARAASAFRAFRRDARDAFAETDDPFASLDVLLSWAVRRVAVVAVTIDERRHGRSGYTFRRLVAHALNMATGYSVAPLRLVTWMGCLLAIVGVLLLGFVVGRTLIYGSAIPGFPFLASALALFSGAQLFALGVLGEYLGRVHFRTMQRPPYVVRRHVGGQPQPPSSV